MRTSWPRLLILVAICLVLLVELRTALAFFDVELTVAETVVIGAIAIGALVLWAVLPTGEDVE